MLKKAHIKNDKTVVIRIVIIFFLFLIHLTLSAQNKVFTLQNNADNRININKTFSGNAYLKSFSSAKPISGLAVSCDITLNSDSSLVRIIMIDVQYHEYLVCEFYPLLCDINTFTLNDFAEETAYLHNIIPNTLKIELVDASIQLKEIILSKEEKLIAKAAISKSLQQNSEKINKINENLRNSGGLWVAGETSVSKMTYEEKKQLFGGEVPNMQGFEYYAGGIFEFANSINKINKDVEAGSYNDTNLVSSFDWRNRHGANRPGSPYYNINPGSNGWITPVRNQGSCGSCWIFGPIGAIEAKVNLYFNQHIDVDLSEQHVLSCNWGGAGCLGSSSNTTLMFAQDSGIINESCFPYIQDRTECSNKCSNPSERIRISDFSNLEGYTYEQIKKELIAKGPLAAGVNNWTGALGHSMCLVGFGIISAGDTVNADSQSPIIVAPDNIVIGKTYLIFKNSWGTYWGNNGYVQVFEESMDRVGLYTIEDPIYSLNYSESSISCNDFDGDGYYYWGLGPKPLHCPACPDQPDGDDSDPCLGPLDENGYILYYTPKPVIYDTVVSFGNIIPALFADGENITWYGDKEQTKFLHWGNSFTTGMNDPGVHTYYVTQTIDGCESDVQPITLTIHLEVPPPIADNITNYKGEPIPDLIAYGENIKWYSDSKNPLYDSRDEQIYSTTLIGNQLWMAENLNYYTPTGSWYYYNDSLSFAETYGRLYSWETALNACPDNWHLPSDDEWVELEICLGMSWTEAHSFMKYRGETEGSKLKETGTLHWISPNLYATDEANFKAIPAGSYHIIYNSFSDIDTRAIFLTSTPYSENEYYIRDLIDYSEGIGRWCNSYQAYSVRCMRNIPDPIYSGNLYKPGYFLPGQYIYYLTQTISDIESIADTLVFTILSEVRPPKAEDIIVCAGNQVPDLTASGNDIRWYSDAQLTHLLHEGNTYQTSQTDAGIYTYYVTQSYSNDQSLPDTVTLTIKSIPAAPFSHDLSLCESDTNQSLYAYGENTKWYSDCSLTNLVDSGSVYTPDQTLPGTYEFYVTQTVSNCESHASKVVLTIKAEPTPPLTNDVTVCEGQPVPALTAEGENLQWYSDTSLSNLVGTGNSFSSGQILPGTYTYSVTQLIAKCRSNSKSVTLSINPLPLIDLGEDTTIYYDQNFIKGPFTDDYNYLWSDGSGNPYFEISGSNLGLGNHQIVVIVSDINSCNNSDTITISVMHYSDIHYNKNNSPIRLYPNPTKGSFAVDLDKSYSNVNITITEFDGRIIQMENYNNAKTINLKMNAEPGIYLVTITTINDRAVFKIMKK
jgi:uncharacterized protein (TIGR02145 family)